MDLRPAVPAYPSPGHSTVDLRDEFLPASNGHVAGPYGLGQRVPMLVVSPWSTGGFVCSEVVDHTSILRFIEKRFGVREPNISPWRRAVCGDLTAAFDFGRSRPAAPRLPDSSGYAPGAVFYATQAGGDPRTFTAVARSVTSDLNPSYLRRLVGNVEEGLSQP